MQNVVQTGTNINKPGINISADPSIRRGGGSHPSVQGTREVIQTGTHIQKPDKNVSARLSTWKDWEHGSAIGTLQYGPCTKLILIPSKSIIGI